VSKETKETAATCSAVCMQQLTYLYIPEVDLDKHSRTCAQLAVHNSLNESEKHTTNQKILDESVQKDHFHAASLQFEQCINTIHVQVVLSTSCIVKQCYISIENLISIKRQHLQCNTQQRLS